MKLVDWFKANLINVLIGSVALNIAFIVFGFILFMGSITSIFSGWQLKGFLKNEIKEKTTELKKIHAENESIFREVEKDRIILSNDQNAISRIDSFFVGDWRTVAIDYSNRHPYPSTFKLD